MRPCITYPCLSFPFQSTPNNASHRLVFVWIRSQLTLAPPYHAEKEEPDIHSRTEHKRATPNRSNRREESPTEVPQ